MSTLLKLSLLLSVSSLFGSLTLVGFLMRDVSELWNELDTESVILKMNTDQLWKEMIGLGRDNREVREIQQILERDIGVLSERSKRQSYETAVLTDLPQPIKCICSTKNPCPPGPPVTEGDAGPDGVDGPPGVDGYDGFDARVNQQLPTKSCYNCPPGPQGNPGEMGLQGKRGMRGSRGMTGRPGAPGQNGYPGEIGPPGLPGTDGNPGERGINGRDGMKYTSRPGVKGAPGPAGLEGQPGLQGKPGRKGSPGAPGLEGMEGMPGMAGKEGLIGLIGNSGNAGADAAYCLCPQRDDKPAVNVPVVPV